MGELNASVITCTGLLLSLVVSYNLHCHAQNVNQSSSSDNPRVESDIDLETLSLFGVTPEFAEQFRLNLLKAIEAEEHDTLRQGEFGGVNGGFFQGGGGGGGGGGQAGGQGGGGGAEDEEDDEDDMPMATTPGPGAFGVLSGLFGIFSGLGTLNPSRIIQSTVNFFPPGQRQMAQMIVDQLVGYVPPENRTARPSLRPRTRAPTTRLPLNETGLADTNATVVGGSGGLVAKDAETNSTMLEATNNGTSDGVSQASSLADTTTQGLINVHKLLSETTKPPPVNNEDDEADVEKKYTTPPPKPANATASSYKVKNKVTT